MKILVHSNAPWVPSGYGEQCRQLVSHLKADHDVAVSAYFGLEGSTLEWNGMTIYPASSKPFSQDVIERHARHHFQGERGIIITLLDVWVLDGEPLQDVPLACWVPVDHDPIQPVVTEFFKQSGAIPLAMTHFGKQQLQGEGFDPIYVPHGIDTEMFKPNPDARSQLTGFPEDAFIVGMVAANQGVPSRKAFPEALLAMSTFMKMNKDVYLYLHTDTSGLRAQGFDLVRLVESVGIDSERVIECDQYLNAAGLLSPLYMARAYNAIDVLLNPAWGEGFGLTVLEAQACGTPVIVTSHSAMKEIGQAGWQVTGQEFYTGLGSFQMVPNVGEIVMALNDSYQRADMLAEQARNFAVQYEADAVYKRYWQNAIVEVSERLRSKQIMELAPV